MLDIFFLLLFLFFFFCKKILNYLLDLSKRTKSLNYLVYILKIFYSRNANFVLEFLSKNDLKALKN